MDKYIARIAGIITILAFILGTTPFLLTPPTETPILFIEALGVTGFGKFFLACLLCIVFAIGFSEILARSLEFPIPLFMTVFILTSSASGTQTAYFSALLSISPELLQNSFENGFPLKCISNQISCLAFWSISFLGLLLETTFLALGFERIRRKRPDRFTGEAHEIISFLIFYIFFVVSFSASFANNIPSIINGLSFSFVVLGVAGTIGYLLGTALDNFFE